MLELLLAWQSEFENIRQTLLMDLLNAMVFIPWFGMKYMKQWSLRLKEKKQLRNGNERGSWS
jgi:hypothetical protein